MNRTTSRSRAEAGLSKTERDARGFRRLLLAVLGVMALLLATHRGEFWPFSIYPMFARGGRAWSRPQVRDIGDSASWQRSEPVGSVFPLRLAGLDQNDFGKVVLGFGEQLDPAEAALLADMFKPVRMERRLLLYRVTGQLVGSGVAIEQQPFVLIDRKGAHALPAAVAP